MKILLWIDFLQFSLPTDIANMPVDSSDTDSDFESAVKATVEGRVTRSSSNMSSSKDPNTAR